MRRLCVLIAVMLVGGLAGNSRAVEMACCDGGAIGAPCCTRPNCVERAAAVGEFNCTCRGSYKFPVPPQYTYHWPGIYAQPTMTEYASPWRHQPSATRQTGAAAKPRLVSLPPAPSPGK